MILHGKQVAVELIVRVLPVLPPPALSSPLTAVARAPRAFLCYFLCDVHVTVQLVSCTPCSGRHVRSARASDRRLDTPLRGMDSDGPREQILW